VKPPGSRADVEGHPAEDADVEGGQGGGQLGLAAQADRTPAPDLRAGGDACLGIGDGEAVDLDLAGRHQDGGIRAGLQLADQIGESAKAARHRSRRVCDAARGSPRALSSAVGSRPRR
jgi:hypothetical protein